MTSNEIILNLDNHENFANSELVGGLLELGKRDRLKEHDWNLHPVSASALKDFKHRLPRMTAKHLLQGSLILDRLRVIDSTIWQLNASHTLRMLHKFTGGDMATLLWQYDKDVLDQDGEPFTFV